MSKPQIKGWCPGALSPMESGDGLVLRVRPFNGRLTDQQLMGIAHIADQRGNGLVDLTSRGNIQIRGASDAFTDFYHHALKQLNLLDASPEAEARRNVLVNPFWQDGDLTQRLSVALTDALRSKDAPQVPHKFGFAVDTGRSPVLATSSADIRLEHSLDGRLIVVADGAEHGKAVTADAAVQEAIALAHWFLETADIETRMAGLLARNVTLPPGHTVPRQSQSYTPVPGQTPVGMLVGVAFGQLPADALFQLEHKGPFRMTPWRMLLLENPCRLDEHSDLITDPDDPRLRISACTGAPRCPQGLFKTRATAHALAKHVPSGQILHVSGCTKGCAHPKPADITITGAAKGLALIRNGRASDTPHETGLTADQLIKAI